MSSNAEAPKRATAAQLAQRKIKSARRPRTASPAAGFASPSPSAVNPFGGADSNPTSGPAQNSFQLAPSPSFSGDSPSPTANPFSFGGDQNISKPFGSQSAQASSPFQFSSSFAAGDGKTKNPFASGGASNGTNNGFSGFQGNLFNIPSSDEQNKQSAPSSNAGNLFAANKQSSTPFGFGAIASSVSTPFSNQTSTSSGSLFGQSAFPTTSAPASSGSLFGQSASPTTSAPASSGSLFGQTSGLGMPAQSSSDSLFERTTKPNTSTSNLFGSSVTNSTSLFGQNPTNATSPVTSVFGSSTAPSGSLFGNSTVNQTPHTEESEKAKDDMQMSPEVKKPSPQKSLFGSQPPVTSALFGDSMETQPNSFSSSTNFGVSSASLFSSPATSGSLFGASSKPETSISTSAPANDSPADTSAPKFPFQSASDASIFSSAPKSESAKPENTASAGTPSLFGAKSAPEATPSLFGSKPVLPPSTQTSLFSSLSKESPPTSSAPETAAEAKAAAPPLFGTSLFGTKNTGDKTAGASEPSSSIFPMPKASGGSLFGDMKNTESIGSLSKPATSFPSTSSVGSITTQPEKPDDSKSLSAPLSESPSTPPKSLFNKPLEDSTTPIGKPPVFSFGNNQPSKSLFNNSPEKPLFGPPSTSKPLFPSASTSTTSLFEARSPEKPERESTGDSLVKPLFSTPETIIPSKLGVMTAERKTLAPKSRISTYGPPRFPPDLNDSERTAFDKLWRLRGLNESFQKKISSLDPAYEDFDVVIEFYIRVRQAIGISSNLRAVDQPGIKRKLETEEFESAKTQNNAKESESQQASVSIDHDGDVSGAERGKRRKADDENGPQTINGSSETASIFASSFISQRDHGSSLFGEFPPASRSNGTKDDHKFGFSVKDDAKAEASASGSSLFNRVETDVSGKTIREEKADKPEEASQPVSGGSIFSNPKFASSVGSTGSLSSLFDFHSASTESPIRFGQEKVEMSTSKPTEKSLAPSDSSAFASTSSVDDNKSNSTNLFKSMPSTPTPVDQINSSAETQQASAPNLANGAPEDGDAAEDLPQVDLTRGGAGEENEDLIYEVRCRALKLDSGKWEAQGVGLARVLKHRDTGKSRVVHRVEPSGRVILNSALFDRLSYIARGSAVQFLVPVEGARPETWTLRTKGEEAAKAMADIMETNKKHV